MPSSKVLDFGSADGAMLEFFSQININAVGLEPSGLNVSFSKSRGHTVINEYLEEDTFPSNTFNVIFTQETHYTFFQTLVKPFRSSVTFYTRRE